jgi:pyrimidine-nucleoside phosphorylase
MTPANPPTPAEKALASVLKFSRLNGWSVIIIAGVCAVLSLMLLGDLLGALVCVLVVLAGMMEVRGNRLLQRRNIAGMKSLVNAELWLLAIIAGYCVRQLTHFDAEYLRDQVLPEVRNRLTASPDIRELLSVLGVSVDDIVRDLGSKDIIFQVRLALFVLYGGVLVLTVIYQGGMVLYYRRKAALVAEALSVPSQERWEKPPPLPPPTGQVYTLRRSGSVGGAIFPQDIIIKKRDGGTLTREEIEFFARGVADGKFADYQASALLMAIFWRGLTMQETAWLTEAMIHSGEIVDLSDLAGAKVDKHSTGGVGDKVSLILAPLAAACGIKVPMMSGRGLGHTGGTLDKLEAIPGFRVALAVPEFKMILDRVGCAMIGQTGTLVPADRKLYALRDVTGTVECIPLICASIMSKKLAEGIDSLVLDVKFGRGAFIKPKEQARELAQALVDLGKAAGKPVRALLTAMDQPLGRAVGHTTEVIEAIECLKGRGPADLMEVTYALTGQMLLLGGVARDEAETRTKMGLAVGSGAALRKFAEMCSAQGGNPQVVDDYSLLPTAMRIHEIRAPADASGYVAEVDALKIGQVVMALGGGRATISDKVDHAVGLADLVKIGEPVAPGSRLCTLHVNDDIRGARAEALVREAIRFAPGLPKVEPLVQDLIQ